VNNLLREQQSDEKIMKKKKINNLGFGNFCAEAEVLLLKKVEKSERIKRKEQKLQPESSVHVFPERTTFMQQFKRGTVKSRKSYPLYSVPFLKPNQSFHKHELF